MQYKAIQFWNNFLKYGFTYDALLLGQFRPHQRTSNLKSPRGRRRERAKIIIGKKKNYMKRYAIGALKWLNILAPTAFESYLQLNGHAGMTRRNNKCSRTKSKIW